MRALFLIPLLQLVGCIGFGSPSFPTTTWDDSTTPWVRHTIDSSSQGADGVKLHDVNADGLADITTGWEEGGVVRVYLHPGADKAKEPWPAVTVGQAPSVEDAVFFDTGSDGRIDVISSTEGETRNLFLHEAPAEELSYADSSAWNTRPIAASAGRMQWMFAIPFDMDRDGRADLVAAGKNENAEIGWFGVDNVDPSSWTWHPIAPVGWVMSIIATDLEGDGIHEIVYTDRRGTGRGVHVLRNEPGAGAASWISEQLFGDQGFELMFMAIGDVAGDSNQEILVASMRRGLLVIEYSRRKGVFAHTVPFPTGVGTGKGVAIGDLDGDGNNEIVITCENAAGVHGVYYLSRLEDRWVAHDVAGLEGTKFDRIELLDIDLDGDLDILTCEETENLGVIWYENPA